MGSPSVNSCCGFDDAVDGGLTGGRGDAVSVFVGVSCAGISLGFIDSWAGGSRVKVLGKMDGVGPVRSSACGGGSDDSGARLVKPVEAGSNKGIGLLGKTLSDNCSRISAKKRVVANQNWAVPE